MFLFPNLENILNLPRNEAVLILMTKTASLSMYRTTNCISIVVSKCNSRHRKSVVDKRKGFFSSLCLLHSGFGRTQKRKWAASRLAHSNAAHCVTLDYMDYDTSLVYQS